MTPIGGHQHWPELLGNQLVVAGQNGERLDGVGLELRDATARPSAGNRANSSDRVQDEPMPLSEFGWRRFRHESEYAFTGITSLSPGTVTSGNTETAKHPHQRNTPRSLLLTGKALEFGASH